MRAMKTNILLPGIGHRRQTLGMTQEQLSQRVGITRTALANYETGRSAPNAIILPRLAKVLGCTIDDLFSPEDPEDNHNYISDLATEP